MSPDSDHLAGIAGVLEIRSNYSWIADCLGGLAVHVILAMCHDIA